MRQAILVITFLLAVALAAGCDSKVANAAIPPSPTDAIAAAQLAEAKAESKEAAQAIDEYVFAKKVDFVANMRNELTAIQAEMDKIALKVDRADGAVKADAIIKLDALRTKWAETKMQLNLAETAGEEGWNDIKAGFRKSHADLVASFEATRQWLSDKIEP
ncbi:MAG: hypothetical protein M0R80_29025 [Proteobacteria bacterium]|jgi:hypothetical protein|nr:hypothetical protein [Pseudomonadota bacterium]